MGYVVLINSSGCELDRREIRGTTPQEISATASEACAEWVLSDGDTIKIVADYRLD